MASSRSQSGASTEPANCSTKSACPPSRKACRFPICRLRPPRRKVVDLKDRNAKIRLGGTICITGAIGLAAFFFILYLVIGQREILSGVAVALIPLGIGAGLLIDARINARDLESGPSIGS